MFVSSDWLNNRLLVATHDITSVAHPDALSLHTYTLQWHSLRDVYNSRNVKIQILPLEYYLLKLLWFNGWKYNNDNKIPKRKSRLLFFMLAQATGWMAGNRTQSRISLFATTRGLPTLMASCCNYAVRFPISMELSPSQELASILWNQKMHYRVHKSSWLLPILSQYHPILSLLHRSCTPYWAVALRLVSLHGVASRFH
jgi:hypothetical protein